MNRFVECAWAAREGASKGGAVHSSLTLRKLALAIAGVFAAGAGIGSAHADEQNAVLPSVDVRAVLGEFRQFEKIEITGSSIVRKEQTQALPVIVVTRDDIRRRGYTELSQVVLNLPSMNSFREPGQSVNVAGGYPAASVHGMRAATLLLLNGMRLAPYGRQNIAGDEADGFDLRMIPLSAVERIEILSDGASSLYGADAIAGVVNIITRKERQGIEVSLERSLADGGAGRGDTLSLAWGTGSLRRDGYSFQMLGELNDQAALNGADRPYIGSGRRMVSNGGKNYYVDGENIAYHTWPFMLYQPSSGKFWNSVYQNGQCPGGWLQVVQGGRQPACAWSSYSVTDIYPAQKGGRFFASGELALAGGHVAFAEVAYAQQKDSMHWGSWWDAPVLQLDPSSPFNKPALDSGMRADEPIFGLLSPSSGLVPQEYSFSQENWRLATGVRGEWANWDYRFNLYHAKNSASLALQEVSRQKAAELFFSLLRERPDFGYSVYSPLEKNNPLLVEILGARQVAASGRSFTSTSAAELRGSRTVFDLNGRDVKLGLGFEYRYEEARGQKSDFGQPAFKQDRTDMAAYGELLFPVLEKWEVTGSVRHDQYSDFGGTTNGKLSTKWQPLPSLMFRASTGTGFRAPALAQTAQLGDPFFFGFAAKSCPAKFVAVAQALKTPAGQSGECNPQNWLSAFMPSSGDLKPEKSSQNALGMRFSPTSNVSLSLDFWQVELREMIYTMPSTLLTQLPADQLNNLTFDQSYWKYFGLDPYGQLMLLLPQRNLGSSKKEGIDFELSLRQPTEFGRLNFGVQGTWILKSSQQIASSAPVSDLGVFSASTGNITPRLRTRADLGLQRADWFVNLSANFVSGYYNSPVTAIDPESGKEITLERHRVSSWRTYDLNAGMTLSKNLELRAGVYNLTNRPAPLSFDESSLSVFGVNTVYSNAWGRTVFAKALLRF